MVRASINGPAILEDQGGPPTLRLHIKLYNFVRNISTNISTLDNAHALNFERCLLYLSSIISLHGF